MRKEQIKTAVKRYKMRSAIFVSGVISRQDLIAQTGFTPRTVDHYARELKQQGVILEEVGEAKRGRPSVLYRSNSEQIIFVSISLITNKLCFAAIDINSYLLYSHVVLLQENMPPSDIIRLSLEGLQEIKLQLPDKTIAAIGLNLNTYCQESRRIAAFRELVNVMRRHYGVQVELQKSDAFILMRFYKSLLLKGSAGLLVIGDDVHLYVVTDGEIRDDLDGYVRKFKHRQVDRSASHVCEICGRRGCVDSLLSYDSICRRYKELSTDGMPYSGDSVYVSYNFIIQQSGVGDPVSMRIVGENGIYTARALAILKKELHLDHLLLFNAAPLFYESLKKEYRILTGDPLPLFNFTYQTVADSIYSAAEMMRIKMLNL